MRRALILLTIALPALSACGGNDADSKVTETRMDDIDSVEGTISDEMIPTDEVTEEAPVEASATPARGGRMSSDSSTPLAAPRSSRWRPVASG